MMRVLLFALMVCLYFHGASTGYKFSTYELTERDILRILVMLGCALAVACFVNP